MPELIRLIARCAGDASRSSTMRAMRPSVAHDAAVAVWPIDDGGHHGGRRDGVAMGRESR